MTQLAADNFTSGGRGSPNAWSPASDGGNWTVDSGAATLSIVSSQGKTTGVTALTFIHEGSSTSVDFDVTVRVSVNSTNFTAAGVIARQTATNTAYRARLSSNANTFGIVKTIAGTSTNLSIPAFTVSLNTEYWIRFKGVGSNLFAMIWQDGSAVPTSWTATATDTSITTAGNIGVHVNTTNSADIALFDNFYAADYTNYEIQQLTSFSADATTTLTNSFSTTITEQLTSFSATISSLAGVQTITEQLSTFSTTATTTAAIAFPSTPGVSVLVGALGSTQQVMVREGSFEIDDSINQVSTCSFKIRDDTGTNHFVKGQQVRVNDHLNGLMFSGIINTSEEENIRPNALIFSKVDCQDNHYFAQKRTYTGDEYVEQYAGPIAADMLNTLTAEGITAQYASRRETTQAQLALGTLSNTVATLNDAGDGDVELALAGTSVTYSESTTSDFSSGTLTGTTATSNTLQPIAVNAIKMVALMTTPGISTAYTYVKIWSGSYTVPNNSHLGYDVFIDSSCPEAKFTIDMVFSDGTVYSTSWVTVGGSLTDVQNMSPLSTTDLTGLATGRWYHRDFFISPYHGKNITSVSVVCGGTKPGTYTGWFRNIIVADSNTNPPNIYNTLQTFFGSSLNVNPPQQLQVVGYSSTMVSVVPTYNLYTSTGPAYGATVYRVNTSTSLSSVNLFKTSAISWTADEPTNTAFVLKYSLDSGLSYITCTNNEPLPYLPAGLSLAGVSLLFKEEFYALLDASPEDCPVLHSLAFEADPSYNATKSDVTYSVVNGSDWTAAGTTLTNTSNLYDNDLTLTGYVRNWDDGSDANQSFYCTNAQQNISNRVFEMRVTASTEARSRLDFAGSNWQNFTAEIDIQVDLFGSGLVYRTTGWQNADNTFAYSMMLTTTQLQLGRGTNTGSGGGSFTSIATATVAFNAGDWHHMRIVVSGSSHQCYIDDVLLINATDSTYSAAGYLGIRCSNTTANPAAAFFDNFGVVNALSGTWTSPSKSLTTASTYGNSVISWRDTSASYSGGTNTSILVEATINGGSTWQTCTNGAAIPNFSAGQSLAGVNLQLRVTLTTSTAASLSGVDQLTVRVLGGFNASGTRISPALSLLNVGKLGGSLTAWNANLPTNTTLAVATSIDSGTSWQTATNGGSITGLTGQPDPTQDGFDTNTSANYTSTFLFGNSAATWTWDTAHSRLTVSGGAFALLVSNSPSAADIDVSCIMDTSENGGLIWRYQGDQRNYYEVVAHDGSASSSTNTMQVFKAVSGSRTTVGSFAAISWTRGTPHIIRVTMIGSAITVYFDGTVMLSLTDSSISASGKCGLRTNNTTNANFYLLRIQPQGQDVTTLSALMKLTLTSTDPTVTPQVTDTTLAAWGNTISTGALIPQTNYKFKYLSDNFDDMVKQSSSTTGTQWWWAIDKNKIFSLLPQNGILAPWVASDNPGDFLDNGLKVTNQSDLYRNRQIITNVLATTTINENRKGDGVSRSWTFGAEWASAPTITVNGVAKTVGVKNVDSGRDFYYAVGDPTITQDSNGPLYTSLFTLNFSGSGQYLTESQYDDTAEQAALQLIEGGSGIVENVEDGTGLTKAAGDALAQARVQQYGIRGRVLTGTTRHYGLAPGQLLPVFLPEYGVNDGLFLIRNVKTHLTTEYDPLQGAIAQQGWYDIECVDGADIGSWEKLFKRSTT